MSISSNKPLSLAVGAALATALSAAPLAGANAAENPFGMQKLSSGYMQIAGTEGKCGAGKCGGEKSSSEGKCGAGKCGGEKSSGEGKCGAGKCGGEKSSGEGKCGAGKCGGEKSSGEGKCGAGKCGGSK